MSYSVGEYNYISSYHQGKVGYVNKFDKSVKLPFLNVMQNQTHMIKPAHIDEPDVDSSEIELSDNIELSSAVVSSSSMSDMSNMSDIND